MHKYQVSNILSSPGVVGINSRKCKRAILITVTSVARVSASSGPLNIPS